MARALIRQTPVLLLDEPTNGLDAATEAHLIRELLARRGPTLILVTHRPGLAATADRVLRLENGQLAPNPARTTPWPQPDLAGAAGHAP